MNHQEKIEMTIAMDDKMDTAREQLSKNHELKQHIYELNQMLEDLPILKSKSEITADIILRHICENCGKEELLTSEEAFRQGWDYPPQMGAFAVISPRTCGDCRINSTLWWELSSNNTLVSELSEKHIQTLNRILTEPGSILPKEN